MIRVGLYRITKHVRNSEYIWSLYIGKNKSMLYNNELELLGHIGESTPGGKLHGFSITSRYFRDRKPRNTDMLYLEKRMIWDYRIKEAEYTKNKRKKAR